MDIKHLILSKYSEPTYFANFYKITRPSSHITDEFTYKILKTNNLTCWKIQEEKLIKLSPKNLGIFFDNESYILQWLFEIKVDNTLVEETLVYYWKGQSATKGYSPLPPEIEENCPVERVVQWSEPASFFHGFSRSICTFIGQEEAFDRDAPHLMLIRGKVAEEIHLYELPCLKENLRSRATFLLIVPQEKLCLYWYGSQSSIKEYIREPHESLIKWQESWADFMVQELEENNESSVFNETVKGDSLSLQKPLIKYEFSPKLFYLNSITGSFSATEIEYPLRAENVIAPFPFLQSHLYTATQPALFLLDNNTDIWLWKGQEDNKNEAFEAELKLAKELAESYVKEKEVILSEKVTLHLVSDGNEPGDFKVIFPFWKSQK